LRWLGGDRVARRPGQAANGEIIASSQGYTSKEAAENGIKSVQTNALGAAVVDRTG
jgi:uncharacterized protein